VNATLEQLAKTFAGDAEVTQAQMFGSRGFRVRGKVFVMLVHDDLVAKLPKSRVDALVASGRGKRFEAGHGKAMKEWVALPPPHEGWRGIAAEARAFVAGTIAG
jgi:TfoX/Sxy family transcriptional regulator of competence genes